MQRWNEHCALSSSAQSAFEQWRIQEDASRLWHPLWKSRIIIIFLGMQSAFFRKINSKSTSFQVNKNVVLPVMHIHYSLCWICIHQCFWIQYRNVCIFHNLPLNQVLILVLVSNENVYFKIKTETKTSIPGLEITSLLWPLVKHFVCHNLRF